MKKDQCLLRERHDIKCPFIKDKSTCFLVRTLCSVVQVSTSAYYDWLKRPAKMISAQELNLYRCMKQLFSPIPQLHKEMGGGLD